MADVCCMRKKKPVFSDDTEIVCITLYTVHVKRTHAQEFACYVINGSDGIGNV